MRRRSVCRVAAALLVWGAGAVLAGALLAPWSAGAQAVAPVPASPSPAVPPSDPAARVPVVASFSLLADLVRQIGGDRVEVQSLVPAGNDVHVFQPGPSAARALGQARLVVVNGLGFEGWINRLIKASGFRGPVAVATEGITPLRAGQGAGSGHAHGHAGEPDPHAWQNVAHVRRYVVNLAKALCSVDAAGCEGYRAAATRYDATLAALDDEIRRTLAPIPAERRRVLTSHDAFAYYGEAYRIRFLSPVGVSTEAEPSAATIARLIREIRRQKVDAFFVENVSDPRLVERIRAETGGARSGRLFTDGMAGADGQPVDYPTMMRTNTRAIASALLGTAP